MGEQADDAAVRSLIVLVAQMHRTVDELHAAGERAEQLLEQRASGRSWLDIVSAEEPPLIIERLTRALDDLGEVGSRFRREEALALRGEGVSTTDIAKLFRVSRQRVSTLIQARPDRD